ncbi:hypothetical protein Taro_040859 [Colocasia esculenta]|uniref:Uncharacterized protein n=1 Tax=Colocasia esculenta TaxID=4460 RepID=A0A843WN36_COLES|nr:hypothetical protein [Colocasia esculenta]
MNRCEGVIEGRSDGPEEEGPLEEAPAEEDAGGTSTEDKSGGIMVEEVRDEEVWEEKGAGEEMVLERGCLKVVGAGGAVDEVGGEGGDRVGRVERTEGSGATIPLEVKHPLPTLLAQISQQQPLLQCAHSQHELVLVALLGFQTKALMVALPLATALQ